MIKRKTRQISLGNLNIGSDNPIYVQSMTNQTNYKLLENQVSDLIKTGCEIIRIGVNNLDQLENLKKIKNKFSIPLIADIHYDYRLACQSIMSGVDGVRINPGNIGGFDKYLQVLNIAKKHNTCIRIGVNSGSLEKSINNKHAKSSAKALYESAIRWITKTQEYGFSNFKVSVKSSNIKTLIKANKLLSMKTDTPIHLGLTEAGTYSSGLIKSTLSLAPLLKKGIGDTIRISLSTDPCNEVLACINLLRILGLRKGVELISCPTCVRTKSFDVISTAYELEKKYSKIKKNIKIAVMGCFVNGPGEAKEADIGIAGTDIEGEVVLFKNKECVSKYIYNDALREIDSFIKDFKD